MESISLTINGTKISCADGQSILQAAEAHQIKIPKLCYHHSLKPFGACRLCLVEDRKELAEFSPHASLPQLRIWRSRRIRLRSSRTGVTSSL